MDAGSEMSQPGLELLDLPLFEHLADKPQFLLQ